MRNVIFRQFLILFPWACVGGCVLFCGCMAGRASSGLGPLMMKVDNSVESLIPDGLSPDAQYLLMTWTLNSATVAGNEAARSRARIIRMKASRLIFERRRSAVITQASPFLKVDDLDIAQLQFDRINSAADPAKVRHLLLDGLAKLERIPVDPALDECLDGRIWHEDIADQRPKFEAWFRAHSGVVLDPLPVDLGGVKKNIHAAANALSVKDRIIRQLAETDRLKVEGKYKEGLDRLFAVIQEQNVFETLMDVLGDIRTYRDVDVRLKELAGPYILQQIDAFEAAGAGKAETLDDQEKMEASVSEALKIWHSNEYLKAGLANNIERFSGLARIMAARRGQLWREEMAAKAKAKRYWHAYRRYRDGLERFQRYGRDHWHVYKIHDQRQPVAVRLANAEMWQELVTMLPAAVEHYLTIADREAAESKRIGLSLGLCTMLETMKVFMEQQREVMPAPVTAAFDRLAAARVRYEKRYRAQEKRAIVIEPFSAGVAGLGKTFVRDLEGRFSKILGDEGLENITLSDENAKARARDFVIHAGNVGEYKVERQDPIETIRVVARPGAVLTRDNSEFTRRTLRGLDTTGVPKVKYVQKMYEHVVHHQVIDLVSQIRLTFKIRHEGKESFHEIKHSLRMSYIHEKMDPIKDTRVVQTIVVTTRIKFKTPEPLPKLHQEKPPTKGDMLDIARTQTQELLVLQLLRRISNEPLELASRARAHEKRRRWAEAADAWGLCNEILSHRKDLDADAARETGKTPEFLKGEHKKNQEQRALLVALKKNLTDSLVDSLLKFLEHDTSNR